MNTEVANRRSYPLVSHGLEVRMYRKYLDLNVGSFDETGWVPAWSYGYARFVDVVFKVECTDHGDLYSFKSCSDYRKLLVELDLF